MRILGNNQIIAIKPAMRVTKSWLALATKESTTPFKRLPSDSNIDLPIDSPTLLMLENETACPVNIAAYAALKDSGSNLFVKRFHLNASRPQLNAVNRAIQSKYQKAVYAGICCNEAIKLGNCFCSLI